MLEFEEMIVNISEPSASREKDDEVFKIKNVPCSSRRHAITKLRADECICVMPFKII